TALRWVRFVTRTTSWGFFGSRGEIGPMPPGGLPGGGRGWCPLSTHQMPDATTFGRSAAAVARPPIPFPRRRLHSRCACLTLLRSSGLPPRLTGTISSTSARIGWGTHPAHSGLEHRGPCCPRIIVSVLSTPPPHRPQWVSSASTRLRSSRRLCPLALRGLGLLATCVTPWGGAVLRCVSAAAPRQRRGDGVGLARVGLGVWPAPLRRAPPGGSLDPLAPNGVPPSCPRRGSNPHAHVGHRGLSSARLPVPATGVWPHCLVLGRVSDCWSPACGGGVVCAPRGSGVEIG